MQRSATKEADGTRHIIGGEFLIHEVAHRHQVQHRGIAAVFDFPNQCFSSGVIGGNALSATKHSRQHRRRVAVSCLGCFAQMFERFLRTFPTFLGLLRDFQSTPKLRFGRLRGELVLDLSKLISRIAIVQLRDRETKKLRRLLQVGFDARAVSVKKTQLTLRERVAGFGCDRIPLGGLSEIARQAVASFEQDPERGRRVGILLRRGKSVPFDGCGEIALDASAAVIAHAQ